MQTTAGGLIWAPLLNQQSCPAETLDKQRLSFCLGCGAERYVLSGDCAPPPPLILRGRTHTERPCEERRGLGGRAKGSSRHAAGATKFWSFHTDATVPHSVLHYCRLQSNYDDLKLLIQILVPFLDSPWFQLQSHLINLYINLSMSLFWWWSSFSTGDLIKILIIEPPWENKRAKTVTHSLTVALRGTCVTIHETHRQMHHDHWTKQVCQVVVTWEHNVKKWTPHLPPSFSLFLSLLQVVVVAGAAQTAELFCFSWPGLTQFKS